MEYVYILDFGNRIKIGRSKNVEKRIRNLETQSGCEVVQSFALEFANACLVENKMHKIFSANRGLGEYFFNISFEEIRDELKKVTEEKLDFKKRYNGLNEEGKIIYLLKKKAKTYEDQKELYGKVIRMFPTILKVVDNNGIITERLTKMGAYDLKELEEELFNNKIKKLGIK